MDVSRVQKAIDTVQAASPGVRNLSLQQRGPICEIHGEADDDDARRKAFQAITAEVGESSVIDRISLAGGIDRDIHSETTMRVPVIDIHTAPTVKMHSVRKGESLHSISIHYYGDGDGAERILAANRDQIKDEKLLAEGLILKIPD